MSFVLIVSSVFQNTPNWAI